MHQKRLSSVTLTIALAVCVSWAVLQADAHAMETPSSTIAASVEIPTLRVPKTARPPKIDGIMDEGEWADASAISNFWYDFANADFRYLAPKETQLQVYAMYDDAKLYITYSSPVYPEGSWLRARGRFPNVMNHPVYGILWDDHIELELRPFHDAGLGFQMGLFKWIINPTGVADEGLWSPAASWVHKGTQAKIGSVADNTRWVIELAMPLEMFVQGAYAGRDEKGVPVVQLPPPEGSIWRCWFARAIGGNGPFFNANDGHMWNTTKMQLIFDSRAVAFQVNELGPIMEDMVDLRLTVRNHNNRSEAVRLGFFVENVDGSVYSSYGDEQLADGLLELIPGETRQIRLRKPLPGISVSGNTLWFDVRSAGTPAKVLYRTRLVNFHSQDATFSAGQDDQGNPATASFKERRIDVIKTLRPPRKDFEILFNFWPYDNNLAVIIDRGGPGASEKIHEAKEARVAVIGSDSEKEVAAAVFPFRKDFAVGQFKLPPLSPGVQYHLLVLLFDENRRIVSEGSSETFNKWTMQDYLLSEPPKRAKDKGGIFTPPEKWFGNKLGLSDVVWEPYVSIQKRDDGFETLNHVFVLDKTGLPAQIYIKPEDRVLPLELRKEKLDYTDTRLVPYGRGPQLRSPIHLELNAGTTHYSPEVLEPAKLVREWQSEFEYASRVKIGPIEAQLRVQYDCDGSFNVVIEYGAGAPTVIDSFAMVADVLGPVDLVANATAGGGMTGSDQWECSLPNTPGIVWDSATLPHEPLFYSCFVPWMFFGSGDRGFSCFSDSDRGWGLDRDGSAMTLERNAKGEVTWRVIFVNHKFDVNGRRKINLTVLMHPSKPKPENWRTMSWLFNFWQAAGYDHEPADLSEEYLKNDWHRAARAPADIPWEKAATWRNDGTNFTVYGRWRNAGSMEPYHAISPALDQIFEDKAVYLLERQIRVGRRSGWWWDEYWPGGFSGSQNIAAGHAYFRDPEQVKEKELPWQAGWTTANLRNTHKRLARIFKENNVPQRQHYWSNNEANMLESVGWNSTLVEECGSDHRSLEVDMLSQYPISLYRYMSKPFLGMVTWILPGAEGTTPGDDTRLDRQLLGLGLLHDIGASYMGPHGNFRSVDQAIRLAGILTDFGLFKDNDVEFIPYWRNQQVIRYGEGRNRAAPSLDLSKPEPDEQVYISVYRRPFEANGRRGYKALIVVLNGFRRDVRSNLQIIQPEAVLGGPNSFTKGEALGSCEQQFGCAKALLDQWGIADGDIPVLIDLEHGNFVEKMSGQNGESYGPVYVPAHNYRLFYAHFLSK